MPLIALLVITCVLFGVFLWRAHYVGDFDKYISMVMNTSMIDLQKRVHKMESLIFKHTLLFPTVNTTVFPDS